MDFKQAVQSVYTRILELQPDCVNRIVGALLVSLSPNQIVDLALASDFDEAITNFIRTTFNQHTPLAANPMDPSSSTSSMPFRGPQQLPEYRNPVLDVQLQNQTELWSLDSECQNVYSGGGSSLTDNLDLNSLRGSSRMSGQGVSSPRDKACHYFNKGHCVHGNDCRYRHGANIEDSFSRMSVTDPNEIVNDEQMFPPRSLEQLESEIREILKARRGIPVPIDALPMIYQEKFRKILQADGCAGFSLTKLLSLMKSSFRVIDMPHGQQAIVLAEDAPKYMDFRRERNDPGTIVSGSRQLYLTFPADSAFTELDVASYFSSYGMVEEVRFPLLGRRMYAFVTFTSAETVVQILAKGNPHYICRTRVLVKPYKEKPKPSSDRSYEEKLYTSMYGASLYAGSDASMIPRWRFLEEQEKEQHGMRNYVELLFTQQLPAAHPSPNTNWVQPTINNDDFGYIEDMLNTDEPTMTTNSDSNTRGI